MCKSWAPGSVPGASLVHLAHGTGASMGQVFAHHFCHSAHCLWGKKVFRGAAHHRCVCACVCVCVCVCAGRRQGHVDGAFTASISVQALRFSRLMLSLTELRYKSKKIFITRF